MTKIYDLLIVGGGIMGCSVAYYYKRMNPHHRVLLLERTELCHAATSRSAALITIVRSKKEFIPLSLETYAAIHDLEKLFNESIQIQKAGVIHVARKESTIKSVEELASIAEEFKQPFSFLSTKETISRVPWLEVRNTDSILLMPDEAYCDPYLLGTYFAKAAALFGVEIKRSSNVIDWLLTNGRLEGAQLQDGSKYYANQIVLATGTWSPVLCKSLAIHPPMAPVRSQYWITERNINLFPKFSPIVILPDAKAFTRPESGALLLGIREPKGMYMSPDKIPADWMDISFSSDKGISDLEQSMNRLTPFFPEFPTIGIQHYIAGFSGYTPDNYLSFGQHPSYPNLTIMAGCVGAGISVSGGVGKSIAMLASGKQSPYDISAFDLMRYGQINCFDETWLERCTAARSLKESG
jgi:sarcosine oxidase, subunit beta